MKNSNPQNNLIVLVVFIMLNLLKSSEALIAKFFDLKKIALIFLLSATQIYAATSLTRDDFNPLNGAYDQFNGESVELAYNHFVTVNDTFTNGAEEYLNLYSKVLSTSQSGYLIAASGEWANKIYDFGAANANKSVTVTFSALLTGGWEASGDYLRVIVDGDKRYDNSYYATGANGSKDITITKSISVKLDSTGKARVFFRPFTDQSGEIAKIDYVKINLAGTDGYRGLYNANTTAIYQTNTTYIVSPYGEWAKKTYNFGSGYANQTVNVDFSATLTGGWEATGDYFRVVVDGDKRYDNSYYAVGANGKKNITITKKIPVRLNSQGQAIVFFRPLSTDATEYAKIDYVRLSTISTDGYVSLYGTYTPSVSGGYLKVMPNDWANKTYRFGSQYANRCVTISYSATLTGGWDAKNDYLRVIADGDTRYDNSYTAASLGANGKKDLVVTKTLNVKLDGSGNVRVFFRPYTDKSGEIAKIDYVKIEMGDNDDYKMLYTGKPACALGGYLISPYGDWDYKTYDFGTAFANKTVAVNFSAVLTGGWEATGDYLRVVVDGDKRSDNRYYATGATGANDVTITQSIKVNLDASGRATVYFRPMTSGATEYAKIDYVEIFDTANTDADLSLLEYAIPSPLSVYVGNNTNFYIRANNNGPDTSEQSVSIEVQYNQNVIITSATQIGGSGFVCDKTSGLLSAGSKITCTRTGDYPSGSNDQDFEFKVQPQVVGALQQTATIKPSKTNDPVLTNNQVTSQSVTVVDPKLGCPGAKMPTLDGTMVSTKDSFLHQTLNGYESHYFYFTPKVDGKFDVIFDSVVNSKLAKIYIYDSCGGTPLEKEETTIGDKTLTRNEVYANQKYIVKIFRDIATSMEYNVDFNFTKIIPTPPIMGDMPNVQYTYGDNVNITTADKVTLTNRDSILAYSLQGTLPAGVTFNATTGVFSGKASAVGTFSLSIAAKDKDGWSNYDDFNITVIINTVENADDLCYINPPTYSGLFCVNMGICKGGMNCKTTYAVRNESQTSDLSNVVINYDETGLTGTFGGNCGVNPTGVCSSVSNVDMGLVGFLGKATEFRFDSIIAPGSDQSSFWSQPTMSMGCFTGDKLYGTYIKDGTLYRGKLKECAAIVNPPTNTEWASEGFGAFYLVNPEDTRNIVGNYAVAGNTSTCLVDKTRGYGYDASDNPLECMGQSGDDAILETSNNNVNRYIDIDEDSRTWNSTSSYINLPYATYDPNRGILWAGLFWQGRIVDETAYNMRYGIETTTGFTYVKTGTDQTNFKYTSPGSMKDAQVNRIKLKVNQGAYNDVVASKVYRSDSSGGGTYAAYADVTSVLRAARLSKGKQTFTVANLTTTEGREASPGLFGGWSLAVIYAEDINLGKPRNVSIYNGFVHISNDVISIAGFRLPKTGDVTSQLTVFSGEGEYLYGYNPKYSKVDWMKISMDKSNYVYMPGKSTGKGLGNRDNMFDAVMDGVTRDDLHDANNKRLYNALQSNNNGVDIDNYDISDIMESYRDVKKDLNQVYIKLFSSNDYITTSMVAYSAELYVPSLCWDYSLDIDGFVLATGDNNITTPFGGFGSKLRVTTFLKSLEGDMSFENVQVSYDINDTTQLQYTFNDCSTEIKEGSGNYYVDACPYTFGQDKYGFEMNVGEGKGGTRGKGGVVGPEESRYITWLNDFKTSRVKTKFKFAIDYTVDYGAGDVPMHKEFQESDLCPPETSGGFMPQFGMVNITGTGRYDKYNLYTQVSRKPFTVNAYLYSLDDLTQQMDIASEDINLSVGVQMIRADNFSRDANTACGDPGSTIQEVPMKTVTFDHVNQVELVYGADDLNISARSVAFRMIYFVRPDTETVILNRNCNNLNWEGQRECEAMYDEYYKELHEFQECNYACNRGQSWGVGISCFDCLLPKGGRGVCSRDNFSIRPETFVIGIKDSNQSANPNDPSLTLPTHSGLTARAIAGYKYRFDINATSHTPWVGRDQYGISTRIETAPIKGYVQNFEPGSLWHRANMDWFPKEVTNTTGCVDVTDKNITIDIFNGTNVYDGSSGGTPVAYVDKVDQIGEYRFEVFDMLWTSPDWNVNETQHHRVAAYKDYYYDGPDCDAKGISNLQNPGFDTADEGTHVGLLRESSKVPEEGSGDKNGCVIWSHHTNNYTGKLNDYHYARYYPYTFDMTGIVTQARQGGFGDFVYINTMDEYKDKNMSYNIQGTYKAVGKDNVPTTNFVNYCYAEDTKLDIYQKYAVDRISGDNVDLQYSYQRFNQDGTTLKAFEKWPANADNNSSTILGPAMIPIGGSNGIKNEASYYTKENKGTMTIDIGLNFDRTMNVPLEPRRIKMEEFNISYASQPIGLIVELKNDYEIKASKDIGREISFQYARTTSSLPYYDNVLEDNIDTPISIVVYCGQGPITCNTLGLNTTAGAGLTSDYEWYKSVEHNSTNGDGAIRLIPQTPTVADGASIDGQESAPVNITLNGINNDINVAAESTERPLLVNIGFDATTDKTSKTDPWVIYNPDADSIPAILYRVRFINQGAGWAGHGDVGNVVGGNANERENRRIGW